MARHLVHVALPLQIPVGHRVEVRVLVRESAGFFSPQGPDPEQPVITDLDTGAVFGPAWAFGTGLVYQRHRPRTDLALVPMPNLQVHSRLVGRVTACRMAWVTEFASSTLEIDDEAGARAAPPTPGCGA